MEQGLRWELLLVKKIQSGAILLVRSGLSAQRGDFVWFDEAQGIRYCRGQRITNQTWRALYET
ncbi:MAG: hypothetical protein WCA92_14895, partial [Terriglobales bacterium]